MAAMVLDTALELLAFTTALAWAGGSVLTIGWWAWRAWVPSGGA